MTVHRKPTEGGSSKADEQLASKHAVSSTSTISAPPAGGRIGLMIYSNAEARHSTKRVLQYIERLKDVETDREGTRSSFVA
jgi:hypothetical protein